MTCDMETGINRDLIREFETTRDLEHLPDTRQLRCYFYCVLKYIGFMVDNSVETHPEVFIPIAEQLNPKEIRQYINMNRKCSSKLQEPCDKAYALNKCWKLNSPEVILISNVNLNFLLHFFCFMCICFYSSSITFSKCKRAKNCYR